MKDMAEHLEINIYIGAIKTMLARGEDPVKFYTDLVTKEVNLMVESITNEQTDK